MSAQPQTAVAKDIEKKLQVFLCHASENKLEVKQIHERLVELGWVEPWLDVQALLPGQEWRLEIEYAVRESHIVLVCLSKKAVSKKGYVQKEIRVALEEADLMPQDTIYLIPLRLEECTVPRRLEKLEWVDYFEEDGFARLQKALKSQAEKLGFPTSSVEVESRQLRRELGDATTPHERRHYIGKSLSDLGDTWPGMGVLEDGTPDFRLGWLPVTPGGTLEIKGYGSCEVQPFYIASYPVTRDQYDIFWKAADGYKNPQWWQTDIPKDYQMGSPAPQHNKSSPHNPREKISWYQSLAFSRWLNQRLQGFELPSGSDYGGNNGSGMGKLVVGQNAEVRLPLEWEWQWAAQGATERRMYPWGNEWQAGYANTEEAKLGQTLAVGMYPQGRALCGAYDMSGNVSEWCLNRYSKSGQERAVRGGSFREGRPSAACTYRDSNIPISPNRDLGFRLVIASPVALSSL
jgi:hypothetical protein